MQNHSLTSGQSKMGSWNPSPYVFEVGNEFFKKNFFSHFSSGRSKLMLTLRQNKSYAESQPD